MNKWLVSLGALTLAAATAGAITALTLTGEGPDQTQDPVASPLVPASLVDYAPEPPAGGGLPISILDEIDPNECNLVHNINACDPDELPPGLVPVIDPVLVLPPPDLDTNHPSMGRQFVEVSSSEISVAESFPPQYFLRLELDIPAGTKPVISHQADREGDTINVMVWQEDDDAGISRVHDGNAYVVPLGSLFEPGVEYLVQANSLITSFVAQ